jgi:hypothetical protein
LHPAIPGSAAQAESGTPAHDRGGAPKGERSCLSGRGCASRIEARQLELVRRSAFRLPLWGAKTSLGSKDIASRPFGASFLGKRERRPGC